MRCPLNLKLEDSKCLNVVGEIFHNQYLCADVITNSI